MTLPTAANATTDTAAQIRPASTSRHLLTPTSIPAPATGRWRLHRAGEQRLHDAGQQM
ncbi:hypothetical protein [Geodermatophilus bullaregiensis]|uniref:hypothetical protein n=1 Tax=Geodermatophilus bullaregiensis TaxID=1564160 RepID=UPI00195AE030|nr:hypothetical protein [Geodermatophilus bullaregiensis]